MDKYNFSKCNICKIRGYITCNLCENQVFFCSRGHLHTHQLKFHKENRKNLYSSEPQSNANHSPSRNKSNKKCEELDKSNLNNNDPRKVFEQLHRAKLDIEGKLSENKFSEAIININKLLAASARFYQEDHLFNLELHFKLAECNINLKNFEEGISILDSIISLTEFSKNIKNTAVFRYKVNMLIGSVSINSGDYSRAVTVFAASEKEIIDNFQQPESNLKLASVYLNLGIAYIYMNNYNLAERFIKKGLGQTEGLLGNDVVYKLIADLNENMGIIQEIYGKQQEAINYYKKSLKTKFNYYGENNEEVLELQYKISCVLMALKKYKEAEEIMAAMTEVVFKEKLKECEVDNMYRYGVYFYTMGVIYIKNNKTKLARQSLKKAENLWKDILYNNDACMVSLGNFLKMVE